MTTTPLQKQALALLDDADDTPGKDGKLTTAQMLIDLAVKHCDLFHDERRDGYAVTMHNGIRHTLKLRNKEFRRWLTGTFYATTKRAANSEAISSALSVLEAQATFDGRMLELSNRFAMRNGDIFIDMADEKWRVVGVTKEGWEVLATPPVLFRRYSHQQALPEPVRGGKLSDIHKHLAVRHDDDKLLLEVYLVAACFADVPRPAITFHGSRGASKTTTARCLKNITDPSLTESVDLGKSPADLAQLLDHHGLPCFDNLTSIPAWAADLLCRAVTGGAFSKRELYSDDSDIILSFKRPMIFTGINIPTHAPDLLDRLLLIELERIPPDKRVDEATFWAQFDAAKPMLFGALLDAVTGTLRHLPDVRLERMPRMADFARIACAYAQFVGVGSEQMLDTIFRHTSRQTQEVLDADPVATAIREFIVMRKAWTGTAGQLLELLSGAAPTPRPDGWPRQANTLSRKMNVLQATLGEIGITISKHKEGANRERLLTLTLENDAGSSSVSSVSPTPYFRADSEADGKTESSSALSSAQEPSSAACCDDTDDRDDVSAAPAGRMIKVEVV